MQVSGRLPADVGGWPGALQRLGGRFSSYLSQTFEICLFSLFVTLPANMLTNFTRAVQYNPVGRTRVSLTLAIRRFGGGRDGYREAMAGQKVMINILMQTYDNHIVSKTYC